MHENIEHRKRNIDVFETSMYRAQPKSAHLRIQGGRVIAKSNCFTISQYTLSMFHTVTDNECRHHIAYRVSAVTTRTHEPRKKKIIPQKLNIALQLTFAGVKGR